MKIFLDNEWKISSKKIKDIYSKAPCTVLSSLLGSGVIENPYFRKNEIVAGEYLEDDYAFSSYFSLTDEQLQNRNYLFIDGLLTIAEIYINEEKICDVFDFHLLQTILLNNKSLKKNNSIKIIFKSPYSYIRNYPNPNNLFETYAVTDKDSPKIRQPNYMFGWDWGPNLADMGITKPLYILSNKVGYLNSFKHNYVFNENKVDVEVIPFVTSEENVDIEITLSGFGYSQTKTTKNEKRSVLQWIILNYGILQGLVNNHFIS